MDKKEKLLGKRELILSAVICTAVIVSYLISHLLFSAPAAYVEVSVIDAASQKTILERYELTDTVDHVIITAPQHVGEPDGINHLMIQNGKVWISEANCPNHDCVKKGTISQNGEMLVCIPHRLTVTILGE